jgi:hypothetical protein
MRTTIGAKTETTVELEREIMDYLEFCLKDGTEIRMIDKQLKTG